MGAGVVGGGVDVGPAVAAVVPFCGSTVDVAPAAVVVVPATVGGRIATAAATAHQCRRIWEPLT